MGIERNFYMQRRTSAMEIQIDTSRQSDRDKIQKYHAQICQHLVDNELRGDNNKKNTNEKRKKTVQFVSVLLLLLELLH